jgi:hypothetical protein
MLDINGQELSEHDLVQLLCQIVEVREDAVRIRILNSEQELEVTASHDEVLGLHTSPELSKFDGDDKTIEKCFARDILPDDSQADGIKAWPME